MRSPPSRDNIHEQYHAIGTKIKSRKRFFPSKFKKM